jgi:hypothetical protein
MMAGAGATLDRARAAKGRALEVFQSMGTVVGVGVTRVGDGYGVKVNLEAEPATGAKLPADVDGVPVTVEVVGRLRKQMPG